MANDPDSAARCYVAFGSNIRPAGNIPAALSRLAGCVGRLSCSSVYRTVPLGPSGQPEYVNGVCELATDLGPREIKALLSRIENELGRTRTGDKYAPRPIDLDLILWGDRVADEPDLHLPHPDLERPFVALPILELAPDLLLPGEGRPLREWLAERHGQPLSELYPPGELDPEITRAARAAAGT